MVILHLPQLEVASEQHGSRLQLSQLDQLCRAVHLHCRDHDILGRHCADTFWLILPNTTESGALLVTKRLEQALSEVRLADLGPLTPSLAIVCPQAGRGLAGLPGALAATHPDHDGGLTGQPMPSGSRLWHHAASPPSKGE